MCKVRTHPVRNCGSAVAVRSPFQFIPPCSPIRATAVPGGDGWVHEVKFDGYRVQVHKLGSRVVIFSRKGHDFSERFPSIVQELRELPAKAAVLDGEVVASDADGRPNFARLHVRWTRPGTLLRFACAQRAGLAPAAAGEAARPPAGASSAFWLPGRLAV